LDLTLFIEREHDGVGRGIDIKADDVGELGGKTRIARMFEGADAMRLQLIGPPDALHRAQRNTGCFGHRTAGPMSGLMRRRGAGQRHHSRRDLRCDRGFAGLAGLVAQQAFDPGLGVALLPAPYRRSADTGVRRDPLRRFPLGRGENDARPFHMLAPLGAVTANPCTRSRSATLRITHTV